MCMPAKSPQPRLTLCDPMDCSLPGSSVHGTLREWILSGLPRLPPWDPPEPRTESVSHMSPALAGGFFTTSTTWEAQSGGGNSVFWKAAQVNLRSSQARISGQASLSHYKTVKRPSRSGLRAYEHPPFCWMTAWKILWRFMALGFVIWN